MIGRIGDGSGASAANRRVKTARAAWVIVLGMATGCVGRAATLGAIESDGASAGGSDGSESGTSEAEGGASTDVDDDEGGSDDTGEVVACTDIDVGAGLERRLDDQQYSNTIRDLLGVQYRFPVLDYGYPFPIVGSADLSDEYVTAATEVAALVDIEAVSGCSLDATGGEADACAVQLVEDLGPRAFRHPLTDAERTALLSAADADAPTFEERLRNVVAATLAHPSFLYPVVTGSPAPEGDTIIELDAYSLASRLSYFVWNSMPDEELLASAESGALLDPAELLAQTERMLADPRARVMQADFYDYMLGTHRLAEEFQDPALGAAMQVEQRRFVADVTANGRLADLLGATHTFANADIAALYGVDVQGAAPTGAAFEPVQLADHREGVLTRLAFLAATSRGGTFASPARRGAQLLSSFFCIATPPPPPDVDVDMPDPSIEEGTLRERWEQHLSDPSCAACHVLIDNPGWAFGNYDPYGRWIDEMDGAPIDTSGTLQAIADGIEFENLLELLAAMREHEQVSDCVVQKYLTFALRRFIEDRDACTLEELGNAFESADGSIRALVLAIVKSRAFRLARP